MQKVPHEDVQTNVATLPDQLQNENKQKRLDFIAFFVWKIPRGVGGLS